MKVSDNKIDHSIDEVLKSKRLKQGMGFLLKTVITLGVLFFVALIIGVATGVVH
jgi:hypothetical protein